MLPRTQKGLWNSYPLIVYVLEAQWTAWDEHVQGATSLLQIKMNNGPESRGRRTQFLHRMVQFADGF
jgi:hypothetical protein